MNDPTTGSHNSATKNPAVPFNMEELKTWLTRITPLNGDLALNRVGNGQSNLTFLVEDTTGARCIVRRPPLGKLAASAHNVVREGKIMAALHDTEVPVPVIYGSTDELVDHGQSVSDAPVVAMSMVDGVTISSAEAASPLGLDIRHKIATNMLDTMIHIHGVNLASTGLDTLASHDPYAPRQLKRWSGQWDKTKTRELPALDKLTALLEEHTPEQKETVLVHGDLHVGNVIANPDDGIINAVIDWELTTLGDPLADVGTMLAYWPVKDGLVLPGFEAPLLDGFPKGEELAERYLDATGRDRKALAFWHVLGLWKVAIICEGVVRRVMQNPSNRASGGAPTQEMVEWIVAEAQQTAREYGLS